MKYYYSGGKKWEEFLSEIEEEGLLIVEEEIEEEELPEKELPEIEEGELLENNYKFWKLSEKELSEVREEMKKYEGMKWKELSESEQESLLRTAEAYDGKTGNRMEEDGECIFELGRSVFFEGDGEDRRDITDHIFSYIIPGKIEDGEIIIDENAVLMFQYRMSEYI